VSGQWTRDIGQWPGPGNESVSGRGRGCGPEPERCLTCPDWRRQAIMMPAEDRRDIDCFAPAPMESRVRGRSLID